MSQLKDMEINGQRFGAVVEAILFASDKPLTAHEIASVITSTELAPPIAEDDVADVINELNAELEEQGRAFTIQVVAGGYIFATQPKYHSWLEYFQHQNAKRKLSPSAVETLAIVAYRQPITKPEVDHIRGVDSGYILRQLLEKDLIEVAGRYEGPGRALLYRTTPVFLQHFGINSIDELPKPREIEEILRDDDMAEHRQLMLELKSELRPPMAETGGMALPREPAGSGETEQPDKPIADDQKTEPLNSDDSEPGEAEPGQTEPPEDAAPGEAEPREAEPREAESREAEPGEAEPRDAGSREDTSEEDDDAIWLDFGNDTNEESDRLDHGRSDDDDEDDDDGDHDEDDGNREDDEYDDDNDDGKARPQ